MGVKCRDGYDQATYHLCSEPEVFRASREEVIEIDANGVVHPMHPWQAFLEARLGAIAWLRGAEYGEEYIRQAIGVDAGQLRLLMMTLDDRKGER